MPSIYTFRLLPHGEMVEWFKAPVLKTGEVQASGGSNPSLSATFPFSLENVEIPKGKGFLLHIYAPQKELNSWV